jgi:hypothetical protein
MTDVDVTPSSASEDFRVSFAFPVLVVRAVSISPAVSAVIFPKDSNR